MNTTIPREQLLDALRVIKPFLPKEQSRRIVWLTAVEDGLLLEYNLLDDGVYISRCIPGTTEGLNIVPRGLLFDSLLKLVESTGRELTLIAKTDDNGKELVDVCLDYCLVTLECAASDWYSGKPKWPSLVHDLDDVDGLRTAIASVLGSVAEDEDLVALSCVRVRTVEGEVLAEGMNRYQYQSCRVAVNGGLADLVPESGFLIRRAPAKRLLPLLNACFLGELCQVAIEYSQNERKTPLRLYLGGEGGSVCVPLESFVYPKTDFRDRCLESQSFARLPAGQFANALRVFSVVSTLTNGAVTLELDPCLRLTMQHPSGYLTPLSCLSVLQAETGGSLKRIAFSAANLYRLVKSFAPDEEVCLRMSTKEGPCLVTGSEHPDLETVIMPMKIFDEEYGVEQYA